MRVHGDPLELRRWHKVVPVAQRLECIMYDDQCIALLAGGIP